MYDISGNQLAIAKDLDGMMVLLDDDCAQIHRTFNTDQWTQRFNELEDDTIWDDTDPVMEYKNGKYVANREALPSFTEEHWKELEKIMREFHLILFEEEEQEY